MNYSQIAFFLKDFLTKMFTTEHTWETNFLLYNNFTTALLESYPGPLTGGKGGRILFGLKYDWECWNVHVLFFLHEKSNWIKVEDNVWGKI